MFIKTCCFIGHRAIYESEDLTFKLVQVIENLIVNENVDTFLFGSKSQFNSLALKTVTKLKEKYPHIKRVYVRAEFQYISEAYKKYLLQEYEETYFSEKIQSSGKAVYIQRNYDMIDNSDFCIMYYDSRFNPNNRNGGTRIALEYAKKRGKKIINVARL